MQQMITTPHNIYIHVPFCMSKCNYCAFFSHACVAPDWDRYCSEIRKEILFWADKMGKIDVPTVFFGGGTPSLMPVYVFDKIITTIKNSFNLHADAEITLESNPKTLDFNKLADFHKSGANRLSVGVQSLNDIKLQFLGRKHTVADAINLLNDANRIGIRVSADFIYGLPGETVQDVVDTCKQINKLGLKHCSLYELTIEKNTPFGMMNLTVPDNDTMAQMYIAIADTLNLQRYEVSNYATEDQHCRHNENIWDGAPYIGIGIGAAGRILYKDTWYEQLGAYKKYKKMSSKDRQTEIIITGMRTKRGCRLTQSVKKAIDIKWINEHPELVQINNNRICATDSGMLILDDILVNIVR